MWSRGNSGGGSGSPALGESVGNPWLPASPSPAAGNEELTNFTDRSDCLKMLKDLNRELSTYHCLALALGGSTDCDQLRDEMKQSRRHAQQMIKQVQNRLQPCLHDPKLSDREREEAERLWLMFVCCLGALENELRRTLSLQRLFALHAPSHACLIKTGLSGGGGGPGPPAPHHKRPQGHQLKDAMLDVPLADRLALDNAELSQLHKELSELRGTVSELQSAVELKGWSWSELDESGNNWPWMDQQPQGILGKPLRDGTNDESLSLNSNPESAYSDVDSTADDPGMTLQQRRCLCWVVGTLVTIFVLAVILGICIALLS